MIKIKHFLDTVEEDDGQRIWVEPIGLALDLRQLCHVDHVLPHLGPPMKVWNWFGRHPDGYEHFLTKYHDALSHSAYKAALHELATAALEENFTLLHAGDDAAHNCATAMYEYLTELQAFSPPEA